MASISNPGQGPPDPVQGTSSQSSPTHIMKGVALLKRVAGAASRLAFEPSDDATRVTVRAPDDLPNDGYDVVLPDDIGSAGDLLRVASVSSREVVLEMAGVSAVTFTSGASWPASPSEGDRHFHTTYGEWFTFHDGSGIGGGLGHDVWLGDRTHFWGFGRNTTGSSGTIYASFYSGADPSGRIHDKGYHLEFDAMIIYSSLRNGNPNTNITMDGEIYSGDTKIFTHSIVTASAKTLHLPADWAEIDASPGTGPEQSINAQFVRTAGNTMYDPTWGVEFVRRFDV